MSGSAIPFQAVQFGRRVAIALVISAGIHGASYAQMPGVFAGLPAKAVQVHLNLLVKHIEQYRSQNGRYPESLAVLKNALPRTAVVAITDPPGLGPNSANRSFFYRQEGPVHYFLRSVGTDGQAFTADDIVPEAEPGPGGAAGLLLSPPT